MYEINETHDPNLRSWVESADSPDTDFPIQNLPFVKFRIGDDADSYGRIGVAIGDQILDLQRCYTDGLFSVEIESDYAGIISFGYHNQTVSPTNFYSRFRKRLVEILQIETDARTRKIAERNLVPMDEAKYLLPTSTIRDYTDFYC